MAQILSVAGRAVLAGLLAAAASGCTATGPRPVNRWEARQHDAFQNDRDRCRSVAERMHRYVDPRDGDAVAERSFRVEARAQECMLARGWNDPEFDGWKAGRS